MKISFNSSSQKNLIGGQIREMRTGRKLSQRDMAAQLKDKGYGFNALTILRIEKGQRLVTDIELKILCEFFQVSPDKLLGFGS